MSSTGAWPVSWFSHRSVQMSSAIRLHRRRRRRQMLSMKLLVDSNGQRVLYGEAGKEVVDFLFSILTLPVGTVVKLLTAESMVGCVGNLYGSVDKLDDTYICSDGAKDALLTPAGGCAAGKLLQLPAAPPPPPESADLYRCASKHKSSCRNYVTDVNGTLCPNCRISMVTRVELVAQSGAGAAGGGAATSRAAVSTGFVKGVMMYTVMDDLTVTPMSPISGITLLNTFGITDIGSLQVKTVQLGYTEGLEILKMSLQSKKVLTDVFLGKNRND